MNSFKGVACTLSYALSIGLIIGGLVSPSKKEQCEITNTYHVHKFTKTVGNVSIEKWLERESNTSYKKKEDFLPATSFDIQAYNTLASNYLFDGKDNLDFINYQIATNKDYMEFYYYYETEHYEEDKDGKKVKKTEIHNGWTKNPWHEGVTGKTKVIHTRYYAYSLVYRNGQLELEKSKSVDDVREILDEYPYISESTNHEVSQTFYFYSFELPYLELEEIDPFYTPTVENNPLDKKTSSNSKEENKKLILKI